METDVKRLTKREFIDFCVQKIKESWKQHGAPTEFKERHNDYIAIKNEAERNGYVGECFNQLWNLAVDKYAQSMSISTNIPLEYQHKRHR